MKKILPPLLWFLSFSFPIFAQTDTIKDPELIKQLMQQTGITKKINLMKEARDKACNCISKITLTGKSSAQIAGEISACIDQEVSSYSLIAQMAESLENPSKEAVITIVSPGTEKYRKYYYEIETALADSCKAMTKAVANSNEESEQSGSSDPIAIKHYNNGVEFLKKDDFEKGLFSFRKAVEQDSSFAFAWDNIGLCCRKLGQLDEALMAYNKSLSIDPFGKLPLQNIPIVYLYKKEYDQCIVAYQHFANIYPTDPETFYGIGNVQINYTMDYENGLRNMCKAYNIYVTMKSPYRVDAEKQINFIYSKMKAAGKESLFFEILKEYNLNPN